MSGPVWLVLPTYDEAASLGEVVAGARAALAGAAPEGHRILVVDDASPDGTGALAGALAAAHPGEVQVLHRARKQGLGRAYVAGFERALAAGAGHVIQMDADGSHDPACLEPLLAHARAGADLVVGSRYVDGGRIERWAAWRRAVSRAGCCYARLVLRAPVRDLTSGFKVFRADALRAIGFPAARSEGYAFQVELTYRALLVGLRVVEHPIVFRERDAGRSKMSGRIALEAAWRAPALRRSQPDVIRAAARVRS